MTARADASQVAGLSRFFKTGPGQYGEGDQFLGIKVPVTREVVRRCWRSVGFPELEECIASEYHEVRLAALLTLVEIFKHAPKLPEDAEWCLRSEDFFVRAKQDTRGQGLQAGPGSKASRADCVDFYLRHTDRINNWDLVDLSCYPLLGEWLLDKDRTLLYDMARNGRTLWEQRIGMVSTMTFIRHGQLDDTFAIADILLHHSHDLIHKAVGWLLREAGKRDQAALLAFLDAPDPAVSDPAVSNPAVSAPSRPSLSPSPAPAARPSPSPSSRHTRPNRGSPRCATMPRTALRYAIERLPEPLRQSYLLRK